MYGGASRQDQEFAHGVRRVTDEAARAIAPLIDGVIDDEHRMNLAHALIGVSEAVSRRLVEQGADFEPDVVADQLSSFAWAGPPQRHPAGRHDALNLRSPATNEVASAAATAAGASSVTKWPSPGSGVITACGTSRWSRSNVSPTSGRTWSPVP